MPSSHEAMIYIDRTIFQMGAASGCHDSDGEGPVRDVELRGFGIAATTVSNARFADFVRATGYRTTAERLGWSYVFSAEGAAKDRPGSWWKPVDGAYWHSPEGPGSALTDRLDHPVVHVSWDDATAYAAWAGGRLPTEAEWECAARGGRRGTKYPWGNELEPGGVHACNVFQGEFPNHDTAADGYAGTCPVDAFAPNDLGLYNCVGNIWEWCADWFSRNYHVKDAPTQRHWQDPKGPPMGEGRVLRGGSFLCHQSYCGRHSVTGRSSSAPDMSTSHIGFRIACDPEGPTS